MRKIVSVSSAILLLIFVSLFIQLTASDRPNIVLILGDDMGYGDIGPYGVPDIRTLNLDRLAREGVKLTDAYTAAPVCSPSRAALLTGRYPARVGLERNVRKTEPNLGLSEREITVARLLREAGYATALFGKWHLGYEPEFGPNAHGFEKFLGFLDWTIDYYSHRTYEGVPGLYEDRVQADVDGYLTEIITQRAVSFLSQHTDTPFFLFVSYSAALPPYQPPARPSDVRDRRTWKEGTRKEYIKVVESLCVLWWIRYSFQNEDTLHAKSVRSVFFS